MNMTFINQQMSDL